MASCCGAATAAAAAAAAVPLPLRLRLRLRIRTIWSALRLRLELAFCAAVRPEGADGADAAADAAGARVAANVCCSWGDGVSHGHSLPSYVHADGRIDSMTCQTLSSSPSMQSPPLEW